MNTFEFYYGEGFAYDEEQNDRGRYFTSSIVNGTTTGVLREHAIRMDSNVDCSLVESFVDKCAGDRPFTTNYTSHALEVSVCAEGSYDKYPWNRTRDRQEITERLWMRMKVNVDNLGDYDVFQTDLTSAKSFTMRCDATSRRGWFEMGNYQNGHSHQPMLESWPSPDTMKNEFNDVGTTSIWPIKE